MIAPGIVGFGFTEHPEEVEFGLQTWAEQVVGVTDALAIEKAHLVGNGFGGAIDRTQPHRAVRSISRRGPSGWTGQARDSPDSPDSSAPAF